MVGLEIGGLVLRNSGKRDGGFISMNIRPIAIGIFSLSIGAIAYESATNRMERNGARRGQIRHLVVVHFEKNCPSSTYQESIYLHECCSNRDGIFSLSIGTIAYESVTNRMERNRASRCQIRHLVVLHFEKKSSVINLPRIRLSQ